MWPNREMEIGGRAILDSGENGPERKVYITGDHNTRGKFNTRGEKVCGKAEGRWWSITLSFI